jgi:hypothetical protein
MFGCWQSRPACCPRRALGRYKRVSSGLYSREALMAAILLIILVLAVVLIDVMAAKEAL